MAGIWDPTGDEPTPIQIGRVGSTYAPFTITAPALPSGTAVFENLLVTPYPPTAPSIFDSGLSLPYSAGTSARGELVISGSPDSANIYVFKVERTVHDPMHFPEDYIDDSHIYSIQILEVANRTNKAECCN